jgi:single-strand DNA-binding protein
MAYLNKVLLIGNTGRDPEFTLTQTGRKRASFSLATTRRYRDSNGEQKEQTDWHNIVAWGKTADIIESLGVHKGMPLFIEGSLSYRSWNDQNGQKRYSTDVVIETFQLLGSRQFNTSSQQPVQTDAQPQFQMPEQSSFQMAEQPPISSMYQTQDQTPPPPEEDDDLPF